MLALSNELRIYIALSAVKIPMIKTPLYYSKYLIEFKF